MLQDLEYWGGDRWSGHEKYTPIYADVQGLLAKVGIGSSTNSWEEIHHIFEALNDRLYTYYEGSILHGPDGPVYGVLVPWPGGGR